MRRAFLSLCILFSCDLTAAVKRFAAVDIESNDMTLSEKENFLRTVRSKVNQWKVWTVLSKEEIDATLSQPNPRKVAYSALNENSSARFSQLSSDLQSAISLYQQSQFLESLEAFENLIDLVKECPFHLAPQFARDLFQIYSAACYFESRMEDAKNLMQALRWLDPSFRLSPDRFPPDLVKTLEGDARNDIETETWKFESDQKDFELKFWGFNLRASGTNLKGVAGYLVNVPLHNSYLKKSPVVVSKAGYIPQVFFLDALPEKIHWESMAENKKSTKGLFGPLGSLTPNSELQVVLSQLRASVLFLSSAEKKGNQWKIEGQWFEAGTNRGSEVREVKATDLVLGADILMEGMLNDIAPDGRIVDPRGFSGSEPSRISGDSTPFYKTWWFWTLAGIGVSGAGVGTYFLLNSSDSLKFQVRAAQ